MIVAKYWLRTVLIFGFIVLFTSPAFSQIDKSSYYFSGVNKNPLDTFIFNQPNYPAFKTVLQTGSISSRFDCFGTIGEGLGLPLGPIDYFTSFPDPSFETPPLSRHEYLFLSAIWVGGIVNQDTLVSVGFDGWRSDNEFKPTYFPDSGTIVENNSSSDFSVTATYTDTITAGVPNDYFGRLHIPLNVKITATPHIFYSAPLNNVIFYDITVENIGEDDINQGFIGIYTDADIGSRIGPYASNIHRDDISGSLSEHKVAYSFDNDGDAFNDSLFDGNSTIKTIASKLIAASVEPQVQNFNWWISNADPNLDFGPRQKGTIEYPEDPFRDFGTGGLGTPEGDRNKYYMLYHPEWDYDQIRLSEITVDDSVWLYPNENLAQTWTTGLDTRCLLSFGPFDLGPDSTYRFIYAMMIGNDFHQLPNNLENLYNLDIDTYFSNLSFDDLLATIEAVDTMAEFFLNPLNFSPVPFIEYQSEDSIVISWLQWTSDSAHDIEGYNIYLREAEESDLPYPGVLPPWFSPDESNLVASIGKENRFTFSNINPDKIYTCNIVNRTVNGLGKISNPLVFNQKSIEYPPVLKHNYAFYTENNPVTLQWSSEAADIDHFNIYKFSHISESYEIYRPFYSKLNQVGSTFPLDSIVADGVMYYYYAIEPYAQVEGNSFTWQDNQFITDEYDSTAYIITSVTSSGFESEFSDELLVQQISETEKDFLILTNSSTAPFYATTLDQKKTFYQSILNNYSFDIYDINDTLSNSCSDNCINVTDISKYKVLIIDDDILPSGYSYFTSLEISKFLYNGGKLVYFGSLLEFEPRSLSAPIITSHTRTDLSNQFLGVDSVSYIIFTNYIANNIFNDSTISFSYAAPTDLSIPRIELDTSVNYFANFPPDINSLAPLDCPFNIATFTPHESSEIIYRFKSTYPDESIFEDKPIGIKTETKNSLSYLFGFHLYYMQKQDAIELIDYIYNSQSENPQPEQLPSSIQLTQNYPNPFNSSTSIEFALNKSVSVSLSVYNILGQKVTTIIDNQVMAAGNHLYFWDAKNDAGKDVSTGIYLYRLETREQNISKKMVFLK